MGSSLALTQLGMQEMDVLQLCGILALFPLLHHLSREDRSAPDVWLVLLTLAISLGWLMRLESGAVSAFIYFQF